MSIRKAIESALEPIPDKEFRLSPKGGPLPSNHHVIPQWFQKRWGPFGDVVAVVKKKKEPDIDVDSYDFHSRKWQDRNSPFKLLDKFNTKNQTCGLEHSNAIWFGDKYIEYESDLFDVVDNRLSIYIKELDSLVASSKNGVFQALARDPQEKLAAFIAIMALRSNLVSSFSPFMNRIEPNVTHEQIMINRTMSFLLIACLMNDKGLVEMVCKKQQSEKILNVSDLVINKMQFLKNLTLYRPLIMGKIHIGKLSFPGLICTDENFSFPFFSMNENERDFFLFNLSSSIVVAATLSKKSRSSIKTLDQMTIARKSNYQASMVAERIFYHKDSPLPYGASIILGDSE